MPANEANPIYPSECERRDLEALVRQQTCAQHVALRARIVLLAREGVGIQPSATRLGIARTTVRNRWRRWLASTGNRVAERLADAPRPGTPATYNAEDACAIIALACEDPCDSGWGATAGGPSPIGPSGNWPPRRSNAASSPLSRSARLGAF